jgi:hypothetical protein
MLFSRKRSESCRLLAIIVQTFLVGIFVLASLPQIHNLPVDQLPIRDSSFVSPAGTFDGAVLRRTFKTYEWQGHERFVIAGGLLHVRLRSGSIVNKRYDQGRYQSLVLSFSPNHSPPLS